MSLKLTDYEKDMLSGKYGEMKRAAIEKICRFAEVLNVKELCEVEYSTVFAGSHSYLNACGSEDPAENFSIMNLQSKDVIRLESFAPTCVVHGCVEPFDPEKTASVGISDEEQAKNERFMDYVMKAGLIRTASCAPYLNGWIPLKGQHFVTTESSNVLLCNSLFGAMGSADGLESCFWASICGRTPKYGRHDPANRLGDVRVKVEAELDTAEKWDLLGFVLAKKAPKASTPVMIGDFSHMDLYKFKYFCASCAVESDLDLVHFLGKTPEALTEEMAFGGKEPVAEIVITEADINEAREFLCCQTPGSVEYIAIGCPHFSIYEIQKVAEMLKGRKLAPGVRLHIWTNRAMKHLADINGYDAIISEAGAELMTSHCPYGIFEYKEARELLLKKNGGAAYGSVKLAANLPAVYDPSIRTYYGSTEKCIEAALKGYWR